MTGSRRADVRSPMNAFESRTAESRTGMPGGRIAVLTIALALLGNPAEGQSSREARDFDARIARNVGLEQPATAAQRSAETLLRGEIPGLSVTYDRLSGAARGLRNPTGYLSEPDRAGDPRSLALAFADRHRQLLGLTAGDLADVEITDEVFSELTGATHLYFRQLFQDVPVYNGQLHVNVNRDGRILSLNNAFVPDLAATVNPPAPGVAAGDAVRAAAGHLGIPSAEPRVTASGPDGRRTTRLQAPRLSLDEIVAELSWLPVGPGETRLVWGFQVRTPDSQHWYDLTVDAHTGEVWTRFDWTRSARYRVYEQPVESPIHTTPPPPADARTLALDPQDPAASPLAWHDTGAQSFTTLQGNNVHAYEDRDANNLPPALEVDCGAALDCDFPLDLTMEPDTYVEAAVTNLFYWTNTVHDIQYRYGFDEAAGNFQENNFANGGLGSDALNAESQDGAASCSANFSTPADGANPRMQMFTCSLTSPARDADLDAGVIVHEYGHGISIRQVGGPANSSCLNNTQQPGEGWSDWLALAYTAETGDQGTDPRGLGSYLFNLPPDGTIRELPYSTDPLINDWTYASIQGASVPHGVGSRWAQALWEVYWALVDDHGFDPVLADALGGAGNQRAMLYVNEGLKNTACSPTFLDARDGIVQAATDNFGGVDVCRVWQAFADFGLGIDATTAGPNSTSATDGFAVPAECPCQPAVRAAAGPDQQICAGAAVEIGTPALAGHGYSWSPGGETTAQITVAPSVTTTYTVTATTACGSATDSVTVFVDDGDAAPGFLEDFEGGTSAWTATGLWHQVASSTCASPEAGFSTPVNAFYFGRDASCDYDTGATHAGSLTSPPIPGIVEGSTLSFRFLREVESVAGDFDRTRVEIVTDRGVVPVWTRNAGDPSAAVWTSSGEIKLSQFAGETLRVRFVFETVDNVANNFIGWMIDDVAVTADPICHRGCPAGSLDFDTLALTSYDGQNFTDGMRSLAGGDILRLHGNTWKRTLDTFGVNADTVVTFDFASRFQGEIHALGLDENDTLNDAPRHFQFWGTQNWTGAGKIDLSPKYGGSGRFEKFAALAGEAFTAKAMRMVFTNDQDVGPLLDEGFFRCVRIFEEGPPPAPNVVGAGSRYLEINLDPWHRDVAIFVQGFPCIPPGFGLPVPCPGVDCPVVDCVGRYVQADGTLGPDPVFRSVDDWGAAVFVHGPEIIPDADYTARTEDARNGAGPFLFVGKTYKFGDTNDDCLVDQTDVDCLVDAFGGIFSDDCTLRSADLRGNATRCTPPDQGVDIFDILEVVDAFNGFPFPCTGPCGPGVETLSPAQQGRVYDFLELAGFGFGSYQHGVTRVLFSDGTTTVEAGLPHVWRDDFIRVRIPAGDTVDGVATAIPTGSIRVKVETADGLSNSKAFEVLDVGTPADPTFLELTDLGTPVFNGARTKDGEVADVDGDGWPDLLDNNSNNQTWGTHAVVRLNRADNSNKGFETTELEPRDANDATPGLAVALADLDTFIGNATTYDSDLVDLDNDGLPDLVQALSGGPTHNVRVLLNQSSAGAPKFVDGTLEWIDFPLGAGSPDDVRHTDVDHDGFVDVAIAYRFGSANPPRAEVLLNESGTSFADPIVVAATGSASVHDVVFLDADDDGLHDVLLVNESDPGSSQLFGNDGATPPGFATQLASFASPGVLDRAGLAVDLNADGLMDFVLVGRTPFSVATADIFLRDPGASVSYTRMALPAPGSGSLYDVEGGDLDLDGDVDLIAASITNDADQAIVIWINQLDEATADFRELTAGGATSILPGLGSFQRLSADLIDLDLDGDLDLYVTGPDGGTAPNQFYENLVIP